MKNIKFLLPVLFAFFIFSCATVEDYATKKWNGKTKSELVKKKGEPLAIRQEEEVEIYVYSRAFRNTDGYSSTRVGEAYYIKNNIVYKVIQERLPEDK